MLEDRRPPISFARLGGLNGLKISRAAFAVMLKYSDVLDDFVALKDEITVQAELESDPSTKQKNLMAHIKTVPHADVTLRRWESASRMRQWINEKKQTLANEQENSVKKEIRAKKLKEALEAKKQQEIAKLKSFEEQLKKLEKWLKDNENKVDPLMESIKPILDGLSSDNITEFTHRCVSDENRQVIEKGLEVLCSLFCQKEPEDLLKNPKDLVKKLKEL